MASKDVEILISARDEATQVMKGVQQQFQQSGTTIRDAMKDATQAVNQHSQATQSLAGFIREERSEHRMQNFLFREAKEVIGTGALALAAFGIATQGAGADTKQLVGSLQEGFMAFQGISFAMSALGAGPAGMVVGAFAGIAAAVFTFSSQTEESTKKVSDLNLELAQMRYKLGDVGKGFVEAAFAEVLANAIRKQQDLNKETINWGASIFSTLRQFATLGTQVGPSIVTKVAGSPEERAQIQKDILAIQQAMVQFYAGVEAKAQEAQKTFSETLKVMVAALMPEKLKFFDEQQKKRFDTWTTFMEFMQQDASVRSILIDEQLKSATQRAIITVETYKVHVQDISNTVGKSLHDWAKDIGPEWKTALNVMKDAAQNFSGELYSDITNSFHNAFGEAHSVLQKFLYAVLDAIDQVAAKLAASAAVGLLGSILSGLDFGGLFISLFGMHQGGTVPKAHGGMYINAPASREFPILVRGGETVRTERQEEKFKQSAGSTVNLTMQFNAPVSDAEWVQRAVADGLRRTGLKLDQFLIDSSSGLHLVR